MKRVVSSSLITLFVLLAVSVTFLYLRNFTGEQANPVDAIPSDASLFFVVDPSVTTIKKIKDNPIWKHLEKVPALSVFKSRMNHFDSVFNENENLRKLLSGSPVYISVHVTSSHEFDFLFLKKLPGKWNEGDIDDIVSAVAPEEHDLSKRNYDGIDIREMTLGNGPAFAYAVSKHMVLASFTPFLVEDALRQLKIGKPVMNDFENADKNFQTAGFDIFLNYKNLRSLAGIFSDVTPGSEVDEFSSFGNWAAGGIELAGKKISVSGYLNESDSSALQNCFAGQQPVTRQLFKVLPSRTALVRYFGLTDYGRFYKSLSKNYFTRQQKKNQEALVSRFNSAYKLDLHALMNSWTGGEMALVITEPAGITFENNCYAVIQARDIKKAKTVLRSIGAAVDKTNGGATLQEDYNGFTIGLIRHKDFLPDYFGEIFSRVTKTYYADVGDYIVFGNQASAIRSFIDEFRSGSVLTGTPYYKNLENQLAVKSNYIFMVRPALSFYLVKSMANDRFKPVCDQHKDLISAFSGMVFQMNAGTPYNRFNALLELQTGAREEGVAQVFSVETDSSVSVAPLLTTDPVSKTRQVVFHDDDATIYFVDNSGNIIWKQDLPEPVMGRIYEVDLFKNRGRQFLFSTANYLYLLDTEGHAVGNYPIRLPAPATNGIGVFDFGTPGDTRIYTACSNNKVYAYLPSGKPLPGWNFQGRTGVITNDFRMIDWGGKSAMVINDDAGSVYIVDKSGEPVVLVNGKARMARFTTILADESGGILFTDESGNIIRISPTGVMETLPLNAAGAEHGFVYTDVDNDGDPDYVFASGHEVTAYNNQLALIYRKDLGAELQGPILLVEGVAGMKALCVRSVSSDKTWLLKPDGTTIKGFPVKGSGVAEVDELNLDGKKNLFTGGQDNSFYVYGLD